MPDKTSMFDRAIPVLASLEIATSLDFFTSSVSKRTTLATTTTASPSASTSRSTSGFARTSTSREHLRYVRVNDIHALHADFAKRIDVGEVVETPWGIDEQYVFDRAAAW